MNIIRINKFIAENADYSRREVDRKIESGLVSVDGEKASLGAKVSGEERIEIEGKIVKIAKEKVLIAYHKPVGVICTTDEKSKDNIISKINYKERIYPIGRLDVTTSGLMLLTNSSVLKRKYEDPNSMVDKEYIVILNKDISQRFVDKMESGVNIGGYTTKPAVAKKLTSRKLSLIITEGKNRQIRKMVQKLGFEVIKLIRVRVGDIELANLERGEHRVINKYKADSLDTQVI